MDSKTGLRCKIYIGTSAVDQFSPSSRLQQKLRRYVSHNIPNVILQLIYGFSSPPPSPLLHTHTSVVQFTYTYPLHAHTYTIPERTHKDLTQQSVDSRAFQPEEIRNHSIPTPPSITFERWRHGGRPLVDCSREITAEKGSGMSRVP